MVMRCDLCAARAKVTSAFLYDLDVEIARRLLLCRPLGQTFLEYFRSHTEELLEPFVVGDPDEFVNECSLVDEEDRREAGDRQGARYLRELVGVYFDHSHRVALLLYQLSQQRRQRSARAAPIGVDVEDDWQLGGHDLFLPLRHVLQLVDRGFSRFL